MRSRKESSTQHHRKTAPSRLIKDTLGGYCQRNTTPLTPEDEDQAEYYDAHHTPTSNITLG
eukprot:6158972-Pyramimonas_sp.AAC.1